MSEEVTTGFWRLKTHSNAPGFWNTTVCMAPRADATGEHGQRRAGVGAPAWAPPAALRPARPGTSSPKARPRLCTSWLLGRPPQRLSFCPSAPRPILTLTLDPASPSVDVSAASLVKIPPKCRIGADVFLSLSFGQAQGLDYSSEPQTKGN